MTTLDQLSRARYVSLTTYRRDGRAVATPVWVAGDGGELYVVSEADAWKVRRIRRDGRVVVTVCDFRGRVSPGALSAEGTARVLDEPGTTRARALIAGKYTLSRLGNGLARVFHIRRPPVVGIAITL